MVSRGTLTHNYSSMENKLFWTWWGPFIKHWAKNDPTVHIWRQFGLFLSRWIKKDQRSHWKRSLPRCRLVSTTVCSSKCRPFSVFTFTFNSIQIHFIKDSTLNITCWKHSNCCLYIGFKESVSVNRMSNEAIKVTLFFSKYEITCVCKWTFNF